MKNGIKTLVITLLTIIGGMILAEELNLPANAQVGEMITATLGSLLDGEPYELNWGDGSPTEIFDAEGTSMTFKHAYDFSGVYTVTLNLDGALVATATITIENPPPDFTVNPSNVLVDETVTASISNLAATSYMLDWGDGTSESFDGDVGATFIFTHNYSVPGVYTVTLQDSDFVTLAVEIVVITAPEPPSLELNPNEALINQPVTATLDNLPNEGTLDWGDDATDPAPEGNSTLTHSYSAPGIYTVTLDLPSRAPLIATVTVLIPEPSLKVSPSEALVDQTVTATLGNLAASLNYTLEWGDGEAETVTGETETTLTHNYGSAGVYTIKLLATGLTPVIKTVSIIVPEPTFSVNPSDVSVSETVTATLGNLLNNLSYNLDWGDTMTEAITGETSVILKHAYDTPGVYTVRLLDEDGSILAVETVTVSLPTVSFEVNPTEVLIGQEVKATADNLYTATFTLDWGDGTTSSFEGALNGTYDETHFYEAAGAYTVRLLDNDGIMLAVETVTVGLPTVNFEVSPTEVLIGQEVKATADNLYAATFTLDWGDGTTSSFEGALNGTYDETHFYDAAGVYTVRLLDNDDGVLDVETVTVGLPAIDFEVSPTEVLIGQEVKAIADNLYAATFTLDWGDGTTSSFEGALNGTYDETHFYDAAGVYTVRLLDNDDGVLDVETVTVGLPAIDFEVSPTEVLIGQEVKAIADNLYAATFTLDWGDGTTSSFEGALNGTYDETHFYEAAGAYTVRLLDNDGIMLAVETVTVGLPTVNFEVNPTEVLIGQEVKATADNLYTATFTLDWGDGTTSSFEGALNGTYDETHFYEAAGVYTVRLLDNDDGVLDVETVTVSLPAIDFEVSPTEVLIGQEVKATADNLYAATFTLDWGDGTTSSFEGALNGTYDETHFYDAAGVYTVRLLDNDDGVLDVETVTVGLPTVNFEVSPTEVLIGQEVKATADNLYAATFTLDWGDGTTSSFEGALNGTYDETHFYDAAGVYTVRLLDNDGSTLAVETVTVNLPNINFEVNPTEVQTEQEITATADNLYPASFVLDWGDGTKSPFEGALNATYQETHSYDAAGVYVVRLLDTDEVTLGIETVTVDSSFEVSSSTLEFTEPEAGTSITVKQGDNLEAVLTLTYQSEGSVDIEVMLDNNLLELVTLTLSPNESSVSTKLSNIPTNLLGPHLISAKVVKTDPTLSPAAPIIIPPVTYQVTSSIEAETLDISGFLIKLTEVTNPVLNSFSGKGTHELVVGGVLVGTVEITFANLQVALSGTTAKALQGTVIQTFSPPLEMNAAVLGSSSLRIERLRLIAGGGEAGGYLDGHVTLNTVPCLFAKTQVIEDTYFAQVNAQPSFESAFSTESINNALSQGPLVDSSGQISGSYPNEQVFVDPFEGKSVGVMSFVSTPLKPVTGDLYAQGTMQAPAIELGCTGVTLKANQNAVIDLSSQESPTNISRAYGADTTPPDTGNTWMGFFFPQTIFPEANIALQGDFEANLSTPVAYSMGGFNLNIVIDTKNSFELLLSLAAGFELKGWDVLMDRLELGVVQSQVVKGLGTGNIKLDFFGDFYPINFNWQPGGKWTGTTAGKIQRLYGKTIVAAGAGVLLDNGKLVFPDASWAIGQIAEDRSPLFNTGLLDASPGNIPPNGNYQASQTYTGVVYGGSVGVGSPTATDSTTPIIVGLYNDALEASQNDGLVGIAITNPGLPSAGGNDLNTIAGDVLAEPSGDALNFFDSYFEVQLPLSNLTLEPNGNAFLGGSGSLKKPGSPPSDGWRTLWGQGDLVLLGNPFPSSYIGVFREGKRYKLGLRGKLELGDLENGEKLPAIPTIMSYYVKNGKDDTLEFSEGKLKTCIRVAMCVDVDISAKEALTLVSPVQYAQVGGAGGSDYEFGGSGKQTVHGLEVAVGAKFGRKGGTSYWYIYSAVGQQDTPLVATPVLSFYEFHGGAAYNMKWELGTFRQEPIFEAGNGLQVQAGTIAGLTASNGYVFHTDGTLTIDFNGAVYIYAEGWFFTTLGDGAFAQSQPMAQAYIGIDSKRFLAQGCVGQTSVPINNLNCGQNRELGIPGVIRASGWVELLAPFEGDNYHLYVGTQPSPVNVTLLSFVSLNGYVMTGFIESGKAPNQFANSVGQVVGGKIEWVAEASKSGKVSFFVGSCSYSYGARAYASFEGAIGYTIAPSFAVAGFVKAAAGAEAWANGCGVGVNPGINVSISGDIHFPNPSQFSGKVTGKLPLPSPLPDINLSFPITVSL